MQHVHIILSGVRSNLHVITRDHNKFALAVTKRGGLKLLRGKKTAGSTAISLKCRGSGNTDSVDALTIALYVSAYKLNYQTCTRLITRLKSVR